MEGPRLYQRVEEREQQAQFIRKKLRESGVIGGVVNDFVPHVKLFAIFGDKRISLGDHLSRADMQRQPHGIRIEHENLHEMNNLMKSKFVLVMTEPQACCESLHWLITNLVRPPRANARHGQPRNTDWTARTLAAYEPPSAAAGIHMIVFTLFKENECAPSSISQSISRCIFSTRDFAGSNDLGQPLGAAFCYINNAETDNQNERNSALGGHGGARPSSRIVELS